MSSDLIQVEEAPSRNLIIGKLEIKKVWRKHVLTIETADIIGSYENFVRRHFGKLNEKDGQKEQELNNNIEIIIKKDDKNEEKNIKFQNSYRFGSEGIYTIKYYLNKGLNNINYIFYDCSSLIE